jgi:hypothetical protein
MRWGTAVLFVVMAACAKAEDRPRDPGPPKMPVTEQDRGLAMCRGYTARLCACVEKDPSLAESCALAKGQPDGLELHLQLLRKGGEKGPLNTEERVMTEIAARKIIAECARADGALDPGKCPRIAPPDALK